MDQNLQQNGGEPVVTTTQTSVNNQPTAVPAGQTQPTVSFDFGSLQQSINQLNQAFTTWSQQINQQGSQPPIQPTLPPNPVPNVNNQGQPQVSFPPANNPVYNENLTNDLVRTQLDFIVRDNALNPQEFESYFGNLLITPEGIAELTAHADNILESPSVKASVNRIKKLRELQTASQPAIRGQVAGVGQQQVNTQVASEAYLRGIFGDRIKPKQ